MCFCMHTAPSHRHQAGLALAAAPVPLLPFSKPCFMGMHPNQIIVGLYNALQAQALSRCALLRARGAFRDWKCKCTMISPARLYSTNRASRSTAQASPSASPVLTQQSHLPAMHTMRTASPVVARARPPTAALLQETRRDISECGT